MKTKVITGLKKELLMIELPKNGYYSLSENGLNIRDCNSCLLANIKGSFTLLGKPDEIKEKDVIFLVETDEISDVEDYRYQIVFIDYQDEEKAFETALESFNSALESEIYWENPLNNKLDKSQPLIIQTEHLSKWKEAQEKTFDRNRTLIFVKN